MKTRKVLRFYCFVLLVGILLFIIHYQYTLPQGPMSRVAKAYQDSSTLVDKHVYRYVAGSNGNITGKIFNMDGNITRIVEDFLKEAIFKRKPMTLDAKTPFFDVVVPVTGANKNYYKHLNKSIEYFASRFPTQKLFVYDIGLTEEQADDIRKRPHVLYRKFDFDKYPPHIRRLKNYAWKILVIGSLLSEFDGVIWFDAAVKLHAGKTGNFSHVLGKLVDLNSGILFYLGGGPHHSVLTATNPRTLEYFPMTPQSRQALLDDMLPGGTILVFNTADMQEHVMKWASICALVEDCIAPPGSKIPCDKNMGKIPRHEYAGCHRYDQSVLSLIVANHYGNAREKYRWKRSEALADKAFYT